MNQAVLFKSIAGLLTIGGTLSVVALKRLLDKALENGEMDEVLKGTSQTITSSAVEIMFLGAAALFYLASKL